MPPLKQLSDLASYRPCDWDLQVDDEGRRSWCEVFRWHMGAVVLPLVREEYPPVNEATLDELSREYQALFDRIEREPAGFSRLDVLKLTELRQQMQDRYGFHDPYRGLKQRENEQALELLPGVLAEVDAADETRRRELLLTGLLAGNIVDLGSRATIELHQSGQTGFDRWRRQLPPRPWLYDDADRWWRMWRDVPPRHVVFFVDNSGGDVVLGCLPLARWMVRQGGRVTLAANTDVALNDITAAELEDVLARVGEVDEVLRGALAEGRLQVRATGNATPLIDLSELDADFVDQTADADLLLLHGMGRGVESNWTARFACAVVCSAVLKDERVAARVGGELFDGVFRIRAGPA